jgi:hypothetical protein
MRRCAYCGVAGPLTREHVFADSLVRECPGYRTYVDRARGERVHKSPPATRDVCKRCNNGPLSALDAYGRVLTKDYFCRPEPPTFPVRMPIDYLPLSRWLLKLSYNGARAQGTAAPEYEPVVPYILGNEGAPELATTVLLGVLAPVPATPEEVARGLDPVWHPGVHTLGNLTVRVMSERVLLAKSVSFNWYVFGVIVWTTGTARPARRRAVEGIEQSNGMFELKRGATTVVIPRPFMDARTWAMTVMRGGGEITACKTARTARRSGPVA